jgi:predicted RNA polymerase sigma factor
MIYIKLNNPLLSFINVNQMVGNFKYSFKAMALKAVALEQIGDYQNAYDAYDVCVRLAPDIQCQNAVIKTRDALVSKYGLDVGKYT